MVGASQGSALQPMSNKNNNNNNNTFFPVPLTPDVIYLLQITIQIYNNYYYYYYYYNINFIRNL
jgi:hypothetical protein